MWLTCKFSQSRRQKKSGAAKCHKGPSTSLERIQSPGQGKESWGGLRVRRGIRVHGQYSETYRGSRIVERTQGLDHQPVRRGVKDPEEDSRSGTPISLKRTQGSEKVQGRGGDSRSRTTSTLEGEDSGFWKRFRVQNHNRSGGDSGSWTRFSVYCIQSEEDSVSRHQSGLSS